MARVSIADRTKLSAMLSWLLLRAGLFPGQLSPAGMRRLYAALLMNAGVVLLWSVVLGGFFAWPWG